MKTGLHDELAKEVLVTSVSSLGSALTLYQSPISSLDKNGDGIISADELAAANVSSGASATTASAAKASGAGDSGSAADVVNRITADILSMMLQMQQQSDSAAGSDDSGDGSDTAGGSQGILAALDANGDGQLTTSEILSGDTQALAGNASGDDDQFLTNILSDIEKSQQAYQNTYGSSPAADTADTQGEIRAI
jgi:hypothetical protein